jgi:acyl-homoserine lactone acylase PvdQ
LRSQAAISPQSRAVLDAYADGVNAWIAANPLPSEYAALELTKANVPPWTALDSVVIVKLIAFGLSFETNDLSNTQRLLAYQAAGPGLRRAPALLRGRQPQRALRARAFDLPRRDLRARAQEARRELVSAGDPGRRAIPPGRGSATSSASG